MTSAPAAPALVVALGVADGKDPAASGEQAANEAREALQGISAEVVILFTSWPARKEDHPFPEKNYANAEAIVGAVAKVFPREKIFGCETYAPLSRKGKGTSRIAVLALGGRNLKVKTASTPCWFWSVAYDKPETAHGLMIQDKWKALLGLSAEKKQARSDLLRAAGKTIGENLGKVDQNNSVLLLLGDMHVPANDVVLAGVQEVLGKDFPILGGSCPPDYACYVKGQVQPAMAMGILLTLPMKLAAIRATGSGTELMGPDHKLTNEELVASGIDPFQKVLAELKTPPALIFVFDCNSRLLGRDQYLPQVLKLLPPQSVLFGFTGSAETGPVKTSGPSRGAGRSIVYGALAPADTLPPSP